MCYVTIGAFLFQRSVKPVVVLFISAFTIAIFWPQWITSISFLLSFFSTLGIVLFVPKTNLASIENQVSNFITTDLKTSLSAQIMTVPLIAMYFNEISLISPISTLIVAPFIGPLMLLSLMTVFLSSINWYLGLIPGFISYGITTVVLLIIELLSKIPFIFVKF